jgi:hypothetical protein
MVRIVRVLLLTASACTAAMLGATSANADTVSAVSGTFTMSSESGDYIGLGRSYSFDVSTDAISFGVMDWGEVRVFARSAATGELWTASLAAPGGAQLVPGVYTDARRSFDATHPQLDVYGAGRGCNDTTGSFTVLDASYGQYGYLQSVHATFEQHCGGATPALRGEINLVAPPSPPPLTVHVTLDAGAKVDRGDGSLQLSGTISCSQATPASISVVAAQQQKKGTASGYLNPYIPSCSPTPTAWTAKLLSSSGIAFAAGSVQVTTTAAANDTWYTAYHDNLRLIVATDTATSMLTVAPGS